MEVTLKKRAVKPRREYRIARGEHSLQMNKVPQLHLKVNYTFFLTFNLVCSYKVY